MNADWIEILRAACAQASQAAVARKLGYTAPVVSQVLNGTYKGDLKRVQAAVEGALMQVEVDCPLLGLISRQRCVEMQRRPFTPTNPMNVKLYRACRSGCAHSFMPQTIFPPDASAPQPAVGSNTGSPGARQAAATRDSACVTGPTRRRKRPSVSLGSDAS
ncbi:MAG TPA: hypothetical protein VFJ01_05510 [Oleiagrimonas sp.]|nr:hypothetical protein [Oleiagrimonas sp.]